MQHRGQVPGVRRGRWKRWRRILLVLLLVAAAGAWVNRLELKILFRAAHFAYSLQNLAAVQTEKQLDHEMNGATWFSYKVTRSEETDVLPDGEPVAMDVYRPDGPGPWPAMLLVEGFDPRGIRAPHIVWLANLISRMGAIVVAPDLPEVFQFQFSPKTPDRIEVAFDHMAKLPDVRPSHLGIFGISVAGGFAVAAATRPSIANRLRLIVGFAPFFDITKATDFALTGRYQYQGETRVAEPHPWTRYIFFYNYLEYALDRSNPEFEKIREVLHLRLSANGDADVKLAQTLSPESQAFLSKIDRQDPVYLEGLAKQVIDARPADAEVLSPNFHFCDLKGKLFLVHSEDDNIIPFSESVQMAERCGECPELHCELLLTHAFGHGGPEARLQNLWRTVRYQIPDLFRYVGFLDRVLSCLLV